MINLFVFLLFNYGSGSGSGLGDGVGALLCTAVILICTTIDGSLGWAIL